MHSFLKLFFIIGLFLGTSVPSHAGLSDLFPDYEPRINWAQRTVTVEQFPPLIGAAISCYQWAGSKIGHGKYVDTTWNIQEERKNVPLEKRANTVCQEWDRYPEIIQKAKEMGLNVLRISISHSKVEHEQGTYDTQVLDHYVNVIDTMIEHGIEPMVTLFHHEWPVWFDKMGHFEDEKNIPIFVNFATHTFDYLYAHSKYPERIRYWLTFNEPVGYALGAYVHGKYYPGKKYDFLKNLNTAGIVTYNMYQAHNRIYDAFKQRRQDQVQVSFAHVMNPLHAYHPWNPVEQGVVKLFGYLLNDLTLEYYKTGHFNWKLLNFLPGLPGFHKYDPDAPQKLDFVGLNYYSPTTLKQELTGKIKEAVRPEEIVLKSHGNIRTLYAEGLYKVIKQCTDLNKPIFITENGCAAHDPALRNEYFKRHMHIVSKAMQEGIPIIGYLVWSLTDCYSWSSGGLSNYGLLSYNQETGKYEIKPGHEYFLTTLKRFAQREQ